MKVSVIVATYNKLPRLKLFLTSLNMQDYHKTEYEIVIIDDGSTDGTKEYLDNGRFSFPHKIIHIKNMGRAYARNEGIRVSEGEILLFCDDDMIVPASYISSHAEEQKRINGVVHGSIYSLSYLKFFYDPTNAIFWNHEKCSNTSLIKKCIHEDDIVRDFNQKFSGEKKKDLMERYIDYIWNNKKKELEWVLFTCGNVSVPRKLIDSVGGFDGIFGKCWGGEDIELGYRLWCNKVDFYLSSSAYNYHMCHVRQNVEENMRSSFQDFYDLHKDENILLVYRQLSQKHFIDL